MGVNIFACCVADYNKLIVPVSENKGPLIRPLERRFKGKIENKESKRAT